LADILKNKNYLYFPPSYFGKNILLTLN